MSDNPKNPIPVLVACHWLSLLGVALVTTAGFSWLFVLPIQLRGHTNNPYIGIVVFIFIPFVFILGLALIALGVVLARKRIQPVEQGVLAGADRRTILCRIAISFAATTAINIVVGTQRTYRAVEHMETVQFRGPSCHVYET